MRKHTQMSDKPQQPERGDDLFDDDLHEPGAYNYEETVCGKKTLSIKRPVPVFGMRHQSFQGADPEQAYPEPQSKKLTETEIRERIVRHGLDTMGAIAELRRMLKMGVIDFTPDNIKRLVDAEKGNAEVILRALDTDNKMGNIGDSKSMAIQIINNVTQIIDKGYDKAREGMAKHRTMEASVEAVEVVRQSTSRQELLPESQPVEPNFLDSDSVEEFVELRRRGSE